jgi:hypothetical protein
LRRLAAFQDGVLTREQALAYQLSSKAVDRLISEGHWQRLSSGVYVTGATGPTWRSLSWAGVLIGGDFARVGNRAAAYLQGLIDEPPDLIHILIPHAQRLRSRPPWLFQRENGAFRTSSRGNPPRISIEDAVLDLCDDGEPADVVGWLTTSVQRRLTTPERLRRAVDRRIRSRHRKVILDLLSDVTQGAQSPIEVRYVREVERAHGLPRGTRQTQSRDRRQLRDVEYKAYGVLVELDGRLGHTGMGRFRDMWRDNSAIVENQVTLRYGSVDLYRRPCEVALQVASVLIQRGWAGSPARCDRCRRVA